MREHTILLGDVDDGLSWMVKRGITVDVIMTSPPYWRMRRYGGNDDREIGREEHPQEYIDRLVEVFAQAAEVLKPTGTFWLNLGDKYYGGKQDIDGMWLRAKQLLMLPARITIGLQESGWLLRNRVIWYKENPVPEPYEDRLTNSYEEVLFFSRGPRYYFDLDTIRVPYAGGTHGRQGRRDRLVGETGTGVTSRAKTHDIGEHGMSGTVAGRAGSRSLHPRGKNPADVWPIKTESLGLDHFAMYPRELVQRVLDAAVPRDVCPTCGAPCLPQIEVIENEPDTLYTGQAQRDYEAHGAQDASDLKRRCLKAMAKTYIHHGYAPSCACVEGYEDGDFEVILSPSGEGTGLEDPTMERGRAGLGRPRRSNEASRPMTRYEQRMYAEQLKASPAREVMEAQVGTTTFAHYLRCDRSGARAIPPDLLQDWLEMGYLTRVDPPIIDDIETMPGLVLDLFVGSGTTTEVARDGGFRSIGIELDPEHKAEAVIRERLGQAQTLFSQEPVEFIKLKRKKKRKKEATI